MTVTELQRLYQDQLLVEAIIESSAEEAAWIVEFRHRRGGLVLLTDVYGKECHCSDIDDASRLAQKVGFKQVRIANK
ncbi:hypothetical protein HC723_07460 [Vibrio sp. S11_S32]|uniref:Thymidylate kinase n=2 Tax=Vibrionaceae TaxID=641 RepID=A0A5Q0TIP6_9VIBR|nr:MULTISPECIES: hypothetical protein [Vibrio]MBD1576270.1 hypothetical protein [Vibrio sp. S11_S32]